jgi:hemerythrin
MRNAKRRVKIPGRNNKRYRMKKTDYIVWIPEYSVGVELIDNQHKELMNLVNDSISHCTGDDKAEKNFFDTMINVYAITHITDHFATEEDIMIKTGYRKYQEHKKEHDDVVEKLRGAIQDIVSGKLDLDLRGFSFFLRDWFLEHIPNFDKPTEEYFKMDAENVPKNDTGRRLLHALLFFRKKAILGNGGY